jgi:hypothetical protein
VGFGQGERGDGVSEVVDVSGGVEGGQGPNGEFHGAALLPAKITRGQPDYVMGDGDGFYVVINGLVPYAVEHFFLSLSFDARVKEW